MLQTIGIHTAIPGVQRNGCEGCCKWCEERCDNPICPGCTKPCIFVAKPELEYITNIQIKKRK